MDVLDRFFFESRQIHYTSVIGVKCNFKKCFFANSVLVHFKEHKNAEI
jgi:hypothetical protein